MRRLAGLFAAFLLIAPSGLRLAASNSDSEALRCAIACGHAAKTVNGAGAGAACCPMSGAAGDLAMSSCPRGESPAGAPVPASEPAILLAVSPLAAPQGGAPLFAFALDAPRGPAARPPDHVPLLLS